jgi:nitroreductase
LHIGNTLTVWRLSAMNTISPEALLSALNWRYATKIFDPARRIEETEWAALEQSLLLAPSSFGLQPWRFLDIRNTTVRAQLREHSWGQAQVTDASHFVVFAARTEIGATDLDRFLARTAEVRGIQISSLDGYRKVIAQHLLQDRTPAWQHDWSARQAYIAMGQCMTAAAMLGIDTCPMEGLDPAKYDEVLGIKKDGYATIAAVAFGYRKTDDKYASLPKVRYQKHDVVKQV